jgi:hypothetical protein
MIFIIYGPGVDVTTIGEKHLSMGQAGSAACPIVVYLFKVSFNSIDYRI